MKIIVLFLSLLLTTPAQAIEMIGFGGSCATQSAVVSQETEDGYWEIYDIETRGQGFTVPSEVTLYSVTVRGSLVSGGSGNLTGRIGTSTNLTSYTAESSPVALIDDTTRNYELVFSQPGPTLLTSTTYYFGVTSDIVGATYPFWIRRITSGTAYGGGHAYTTTDTRWNMVTELTTRDLYFIIKRCD